MAKRIAEKKAIHDAKNAKKGIAIPASVTNNAIHKTAANANRLSLGSGSTCANDVNRCGRNVATMAANDRHITVRN